MTEEEKAEVDAIYEKFEKGLKPCPFCGGPAYPEKFIGKNKDFYVMIKCSHCQAQSHACLWDSKAPLKAQLKHIGSYWNKRAYVLKSNGELGVRL